MSDPGGTTFAYQADDPLAPYAALRNQLEELNIASEQCKAAFRAALQRDEDAGQGQTDEKHTNSSARLMSIHVAWLYQEQEASASVRTTFGVHEFRADSVFRLDCDRYQRHA